MKIDHTIFDKIDISRFGRYRTYNYFPVCTTYKVLFMGMISINYNILIKIVTIIFE
jgi:hypothetical protein